MRFLVAGSIACFAVAAVLTYLVVTQWPPLLASDLAIDTWIHGVAVTAPGLVVVAEVLNWTGSPVFLTPLTTAVVIGLLVTRRVGWAGYLAATALGGVVLSEVIKSSVARPRPTWPDPLWVEDGFSFTSGHSLAGITNWLVYGVIVLFCVPGSRGRVAAGVLMAWGLLMAPSRLVLGVHWPADVVGGWMVGLGWVLAVSAVAVVLVSRRAGARAAPV